MRNRNRRLRLLAGLCLCHAVAAVTGCVGGPSPGPSEIVPSVRRYHPEISESAAGDRFAELEPAAWSAPDETPPNPKSGELTVAFVIDEVLARNPTLAQMEAAVHAAFTRYPQVTSLDDPAVSGWVAPASLGSNKVNDAARIEVSQKFPFPGKRELRGQSALAQAAVAGYELEDSKLQLIESARAAFAEYHLATRALEVNAEGLKLLSEFKANAETRYRTGQSPQQDILQAEVEAGRQDERRLVIERGLAVARARLNTLMNLPPDMSLPPPGNLAKPSGLPDAQTLRETAIARRPDLRNLAARIDADQAAVALAKRESYPDIEAMAAFDSFWQAADSQQRLRPQVGVRMNLPVRLDRRQAVVAEAEAMLAGRRAELARLTSRVLFEVEQSAAQVRESEATIRLYAEKILPAARENVKAAQSAYVTGKVPFLTLIEARRGLVDLLDRSNQAVAEYEQRRATLERAVGGPVAFASDAPRPSGKHEEKGRGPGFLPARDPAN